MSVYDEGFKARLRGQVIEGNPYPRSSDDWAQWAEGWLDQDQHLTTRDAAMEYTFGTKRFP